MSTAPKSRQYKCQQKHKRKQRQTMPKWATHTDTPTQTHSHPGNCRPFYTTIPVSFSHSGTFIIFMFFYGPCTILLFYFSMQCLSGPVRMHMCGWVGGANAHAHAHGPRVAWDPKTTKNNNKPVALAENKANQAGRKRQTTVVLQLDDIREPMLFQITNPTLWKSLNVSFFFKYTCITIILNKKINHINNYY